VQNFTINIIDNVALLSWDPLSEANFSHYEVRYSSSQTALIARFPHSVNGAAANFDLLAGNMLAWRSGRPALSGPGTMDSEFLVTIRPRS
jgi:hypothetical protein